MKRSDWRCSRCYESSNADEPTCVHCDWPRDTEILPGKSGKYDRSVGKHVWTCPCGRKEDDDCTECTSCTRPRWSGCEQFDGSRFFVNRTPMDRELDCSSMPLLHWLQLLRPPSDEEVLSAVFVSGIVDDLAEAHEFAAQFFPKGVAAWMVAQDCSADVKKDETKYHKLGSDDYSNWRGLFFKPKTGLMHIKVCSLFSRWHVLICS